MNGLLALALVLAFMWAVGGWFARTLDGYPAQYHLAALGAVGVIANIALGTPFGAAIAGVLAAETWRQAWIKYKYGCHPNWDITVTVKPKRRTANSDQDRRN